VDKPDSKAGMYPVAAASVLPVALAEAAVPVRRAAAGQEEPSSFPPLS
jgi:hypothetical protein